jgi:hypothetical protein
MSKPQIELANDELVVITGSSKRFSREIYALAEKLRKEGKTVIVDFIFHNLPEWKSRRQFIRAILDADKLMVFNMDGYIGFHSHFEATLAEMCGVKVEYLFSGKFVSLTEVEQDYYNRLRFMDEDEKGDSSLQR